MMSGTSAVQTDEDCVELDEDGFVFSPDISEKLTRRNRSFGKPCPKSPYLSSLNMNTRRAAVAAWRLPRASLGDTRGDVTGEMGFSCLTSLSNGHDVSHTLRSECDVPQDLLRDTWRKNRQHLNMASNGFSSGAADYREKEDMYDEIIRLKKSLHVQKSDNRKMQAKLRRLEEDNAKREKQLEELLDPTKGSEYTRSLVDKKKEGSVILNGLKQRILKLEQQCREKENALSKLQSELRATNLEELKITVKTYFEEIQRLKILLEAAEKSNRTESKCSQRQQKALSSTVVRLSENVKQLQQENMELREELDTASPAEGSKGYREWSKQRVLRRLLEVEKRLADARRHAPCSESGSRLDREVQTSANENQDRLAMATEAGVSVGTQTEEDDEVDVLRERVSQLEAQKVTLQDRLSAKDDELQQLRTEHEEVEKERERWKTEEKAKEEQHELELERLHGRLRTLEENRVKLSPTVASQEDQSGAAWSVEEDRAPEPAGDDEVPGTNVSESRQQKDRDEAARVVQRNWRKHRTRAVVKLQSAFRGHLYRESALRLLRRDAQSQGGSHHGDSSVGGPDDVALTVMQSAFRGHVARCRLVERMSSSGDSLPAPALTKPDTTLGRTVRAEPPCSPDETAEDSDDSDDIIVSPSRPMRSREALIL
ncbi:IQ domain-containing protein E isoform 1-T3 [Synchiropus picturatus]